MSPAPDARQLRLHQDLLAALADDPYLRFELDPGTLEEVATRPGAAVAWVGRHHSGLRWVTGLALDAGRPDHLTAAVDLVTRVALPRAGTDRAVAGVTVSRGAHAQLPADLRPPEPWEWDFWWTDSPPPETSLGTAYDGAAVVTDLDGSDPRLGPLLELASPTAPLRPGDPRVVRWAGVVDPEGGLPGTGGLAAVLAVTRPRSGVDHLNDVATHPERRGRRLARFLCGQVTRDSLQAGRPAVTLGMYADNDAARRVYDSLGFVCHRGQTSGRLVPHEMTGG